MRVSDRMLSRNYVKMLQDSMYKVVQENKKLANQMKYENMSDNVADCSRALRADGQVKSIERQIKGIEGANAQLSAADETLQDLSDVFSDAHKQIINAMNAPGDTTKLLAIADQIANYKNEILQFTNGKFADKYLFAGMNSGSAPFQVGDDGMVKYNGIPVDQIFKKDGEYYYNDGVTDKPIPRDEDIYLDVGRGIQIQAGKIDPASAFKISFSGLDILGANTTTDPATGLKMSNNVYNLLQQVEDLLRSGELEKGAVDANGGANAKNPAAEKLGALMDHAKSRYEGLLSNLTDLGGRVNFLERTQSRLNDQVDTLEALKKQLVGINSEEQTTAYADAKAAYMSVLTMGPRFFETTLIDFLR